MQEPSSPRSSLFGSSRVGGGGGSDWRTRLAERSKDADNDDVTSASARTKNVSKSSETSSEGSQESDASRSPSESESNRISPHSRRVAHRNIRETRRPTGVPYMSDQKQDEVTENLNVSIFVYHVILLGAVVM